MARGILLVLSDPSGPEVDEAYNDWYDNVHLPEILALSGFQSARRYRMSNDQLPSQGGFDRVRARFPNRYVATYEVEAEDLKVAVDALTAAGNGLNRGAAFDYGTTLAVLFEEISSR